MKKTFAVLIAIMLLSGVPEKKYKFEFNDAQLNAIWNCIDNSSAPHDQVKQVQALIQQQLQPQLQQPKTDSTKKK